MRTIKQYWVLTLTVFLSIAAYMFLSAQSVDLEFRPLSSPPGFRELVLDNSSTRIDPLLGLNQASARAATAGGAANFCDALLRDPMSPILGGDEAVIDVVEFFDYRCPYCKKLTNIIKGIADSDSRVRIVYKEWPILGKSSELSSRAALAAARQGKYLEFHHQLMRSGFIPTIGYIEGMAADLGLDLSQLRKDMGSNETRLAIQRNAALAARFGFKGTPSLVVGRTIVQGAITRAQLEELVEIEISSNLEPRREPRFNCLDR